MTPLTHTDLYLCLFHTRARGWMQFENDLIDAESEAVEHVRAMLDLWKDHITAVHVRLCPFDAMHRDVTEDILALAGEWVSHPLTENKAA